MAASCSLASSGARVSPGALGPRTRVCGSPRRGTRDFTEGRHDLGGRGCLRDEQSLGGVGICVGWRGWEKWVSSSAGRDR